MWGDLVLVRPTVLAGTPKDDVVGRHGVPAAVRDTVDCRLEARILERLDFAAVVTDEVVVMVAALVCGLEARDAVAEIDPLDETEAIEAVERAVHARDPDTGADGAQAVVNLLGRQAAPLSAQEFDYGSPRAPTTPARLSQACERTLGPRALGRHRR